MPADTFTRRAWLQTAGRSGIAAATFASCPARLWAADSAAATELGSRREFFVDESLIAERTNVELVMHRPRDEGQVLAFDKPWEGGFSGYATVIHDRDRYRLYYRGLGKAGQDGNAAETTCYAESPNGIEWVKPELGLFEVQGTRKNNIVLANAAPATHNFSPFRDTNPETTANARYKALGGTMKSGLIGWSSADGVHWKKIPPAPVIPNALVEFPYFFDSQNVAFWSAAEECYVCYFRVFDRNIRRIARTTSDDFRTWSPPVLMQYRHRNEPAPVEHLYTNQTHPYFRGPHLYLAIAARFMPGRQVLTEAQANAIDVNPKYFQDTSDAVLMTTRPGQDYYHRTFLSSFIRPGIGARNWVSRTNYPALNVVQTSDTEMSLYLNQDYAQPTAHLRRYSLRLDGFASAQANYHGGQLLTKPITFTGRQLQINFATSAAGAIEVQLEDTAGNPIPEFTFDDCIPVIGNEIERDVLWKSGTDLSQLAGRPIQVRFRIRDADLYAYRFATPPLRK